MDTIADSKKSSLKGSDKKEAFHREAEARRIPYRYVRPDVDLKGKRAIYFLGKTDILKAQVQIVPVGGENDLHYHPGTDGFWWVIQGKARFYDGDGDEADMPGYGLKVPHLILVQPLRLALFVIDFHGPAMATDARDTSRLPNQAIRVGHASPVCLFGNVEVFGEAAV